VFVLNGTHRSHMTADRTPKRSLHPPDIGTRRNKMTADRTRTGKMRSWATRYTPQFQRRSTLFIGLK
jgi:hypothetical protein